MNHYYILNDNNEPIPTDDVSAWGRWFDSADTNVAKTKVGDAEVSTVFLGLNHQYGDGPPLLYETLVFGGKLADEQDRYSTLEEAKHGHERMVQRVQMAEFNTLMN